MHWVLQLKVMVKKPHEDAALMLAMQSMRKMEARI